MDRLSIRKIYRKLLSLFLAVIWFEPSLLQYYSILAPLEALTGSES